MRALSLMALCLAVFALGLSPLAASAAASFPLPFVTLASPQCGVLDVDCTLSAGPLATAFGTFALNATGDLANAQFTSGPSGMCMPLSGTATLTFGAGGADKLVLVGGAGKSLCYTQGADAAGFPLPPSGPWPLALTFGVDSSASTGLYAGATGNATIDGTWLTSVSCFDDDGNPIQTCGLSGEPIASFTLNSVSIPDLTIPGNGGGCTSNCGGGGGDGGPDPSATPELDSIALFASGLAGAGGYALLRYRAGRK